AASLALMFSAIQQYQTQKISFSVDTSYLHWKTNFPSIVICEKKNSKVRSLRSKIRPDLEKLVFFDGSLSPQDKSACTESGKFRQQCLLGNYSDYMHKFRSKCSEIIGFCYYNDEDFSCCEEFLPVQTYHGPCFAFNSLVSGGTISTRDDLHFKITRDLDYGYGNLSIELFHAEVFVYALSQDAVPTKDTASKLALLETSKKSLRKGFQYNCFLSAMETSTDDVTRLMSVENRGCRFYDENILRYSSVYSMSACENECRANAQMKVCGCIVHTLPHNDEKDCDFDGIVCIVDNDKTISQIVKTCSCFSSCFDMEINNIGYTINAQNQQSENAKKEVRINFIVSPPYLHFTRKVVKTPLSMLGNGFFQVISML
ncbi:sodium channel protein Nach-like, partial [Asbolus verrucosus]